MATVLDLGDVKKYLKIADGTNDTALEAQLAAAEQRVSSMVGPLEPTTVTTKFPFDTVLLLPVLPVISLTSVTPSTGVPLTVSDLVVDEKTGLIEYASGTCFPQYPRVRYTVVYQAGYNPLPDDIKLAVFELVRHFWQPQRGAPVRNPGATPPETTPGGVARELPNRVTQLLDPYSNLAIG